MAATPRGQPMSRARLGLLVAVVWLAALTLSSLIAQPPLPTATLMALGRVFLDGLAVALLVLAGGGVGTLAMRDLPRLSGLERLALRALAGLGAISLAVLCLGLLGWLPSRWIGWLATLAVLAILHRPVRRWIGEAREWLPLYFGPSPASFTRWLRVAVLALLGLALLMSLAPPTKWDALTYHLAGPRAYLEAGRIISIPHNHFLGFPQLTEMLYLWLLILARPQAAALLHWAFGMLLLLSLLGLTRRLRHPDAGWLAAAILLAGASVWGEFGWPYNDLAQMAMTFAALVMLQAFGEIGQGRRYGLLVWSGLFTGLAMSTKYTSAGAALGIAALSAWLSRHEGFGAAVQRIGMVAGVALIAFAPWLIKNALLDGNPVAPFVWGTSGFDALDQWYYLRPGTGLSLRSLITFPLEATVYGREGLGPYMASSGPLLIGLLPLAAVNWHRRPPSDRALIVGLLIFSLPPYLAWLAGAATSWFMAQTRLLFPLFPALALVGALGLDGLGEEISQSADLVKVVQAAVLIAVAVALLSASIAVAGSAPLPVVAGLQPEEDYLLQHLGTHYAAMQQINALPEDARVLTLWEPRIFYCIRRCVPDSLINQWWHDRQIEPDPARIAARWRAEGISHVLIFESGWRFLYYEEGHEPLTQADLEMLDRLREEEMTLIWEGYGAYTLYQLHREPAP